MPTVKRLNKVLTIPVESIESYLQDGFDVIDEKGKVIKRATGGRTVTIKEHNKVVDELESLQEENKKLKAENSKLKKGE